MRVYVDTSAIYALLDRADRFHEEAAAWWREELDAISPMTSEWVVLESGAIIQSRLGIAALRALRDALLPVVEVLPVSAEVRDRAFADVIASDRRSVSLVDRSSFEIMRRRGIDRAFAFDPDFAEAGFEPVPAG